MCARRQGVVCSLPKCDALVHPAATLVLEQMRARVIDLMAGSSQGHHPGTRQVPRHRRDDVPGNVLAHCQTRSHTPQPDRNLRAPCRRTLSATAINSLLMRATRLGLAVARWRPVAHPAHIVHGVCTTAVLYIYMLLAGDLGDVRPHVQVNPSPCDVVVELDRLSSGLG